MGKFTHLCFALLFVFVIFSVCDGYKRSKHHGMKKNDRKWMKTTKDKYNKKGDFKLVKNRSGFGKSHNGISSHEHAKQDVGKYVVAEYPKFNTDKMYGKQHMKLKHKMKWDLKNKKHKKGKKKNRKMDLQWMKFKPGQECQPSCEKGEMCIVGPMDTKPFCVKKRNLMKSIKIFRRYQKKEMKQWRKFKKDHYNDVYDYAKFDKSEKANVDGTMKKEHLKKHGHDHNMEKKGKKHHLHKPLVPPHMDDDNECSTADFSQMRTRMMGWFHVLHGQDHLLKKQEKGSLKHFHKHVSVKKELRENDGQKCQCFKSAMWQFHEMDANRDDQLTSTELMVIEENSLEPCVKPYLTSCDQDANGVLSADEWCCCFSHIVAPCFKKVDEMRRSGDKSTYLPRCDKEGYYMREQCRGDSENEDNYGCWCVDYNGNEYKGTFKNGRAHCSKIALRGLDKIPMV